MPSKDQPIKTEVPAAGLVDDAAVHEIPALPGDDEVAAIAAEQEAAARSNRTEAAAEAAEAGVRRQRKARRPRSDKPAADEGKEG